MNPKQLYAALAAICHLLRTVQESAPAPLGAITQALQAHGATASQVHDLLGVVSSNGWVVKTPAMELLITEAGKDQLIKFEAKRAMAARAAGLVATSAPSSI